MTQQQNTLNNIISQSPSGSVITAFAQLKHTKETKSIANGASILTMNVNQNAIGVRKQDFALLTKLFKKQKKEKNQL